jgi:hypothetical protein
MMEMQSKRRMEIFRAADAVDNGGPQGMRGQSIGASDTMAKMKCLQEVGILDGSVSSLLYRQENGFSLIHLWIKPHYPLPRHSHDSDCLYYVVSGSIVLGSETLRASDGFFVPADANYVYVGGPEGAEIIEIRHGANSIVTAFPPISDTRRDKDRELIAANHAAWLAMTTAPTFEANRQGRIAAEQSTSAGERDRARPASSGPPSS